MSRHDLYLMDAHGVNAETLTGLFQERVRLSPASQAYQQFDAAACKWVGYTWADVEARVRQRIAALRREDLPVGARIGILLPNGVEHVCLDQAALAQGLTPVPLHVIDNTESLAYVVSDCGASLLVVDTAARWSALAAFGDRFPDLRRVVYAGGPDEPSVGPLALPLGRWLADPGGDCDRREAPLPIRSDSLAAIVYTSGTTGRPKGVMLSHENVIANVRSILAAMPVHADDVFLSFLPLSHTLERTVGYYLPIAAGAMVAFARSVPLLMADLGTIRPTVLVSVPRIYERAYAALRERLGSHRLLYRLLLLTVRLGWQHFEYAQGRAARPALDARALHAILDVCLGRPVRARFGGRLRAAVTGGAAMSAEVAQPLLALGVPLLQGYGMTESAPVVACNVPEDNDPASVGRPLPGVSVRIGEQEELLVRGANVMVGYWRRPEDTARAKDPEGWLHTGDQARIVAGRIVIQGRIKDIIVTSTGEKIAPGDLEAAIAGDPLFDQVMVIGERRPYLAALLVVNRERWAPRAVELGLDPRSASSLESETARRWARERVAGLLRAFPGYAAPRAVYLSFDPWTVAGGLITPTLKPKRPAIEAHFAAQIAELYRGH